MNAKNSLQRTAARYLPSLSKKPAVRRAFFLKLLRDGIPGNARGARAPRAS
jgi:hypothetical protein